MLLLASKFDEAVAQWLILEAPVNVGGYSARKLFTGLAIAALIAWELIVASAAIPLDYIAIHRFVVC